MNIIKINDVVVPDPVRGLNFNHTPQYAKMKNAKGGVVVQQISDKKQLSFQNIEWRYLTYEEWEKIVHELNKGIGSITFFDSEKGKTIKVEVLFENISETPYLYNEDNKIKKYSSCSCTVTDLLRDRIEVDDIA